MAGHFSLRKAKDFILVHSFYLVKIKREKVRKRKLRVRKFS